MAVAEEVAHEREYVDAIRAEALAEQRPPPGRADIDAITEAENRRDAEVKTALSRLALGQLRIEGLLHELIAETRARELRTDYPHEDSERDLERGL